MTEWGSCEPGTYQSICPRFAPTRQQKARDRNYKTQIKSTVINGSNNRETLTMENPAYMSATLFLDNVCNKLLGNVLDIKVIRLLCTRELLHC